MNQISEKIERRYKKFNELALRKAGFEQRILEVNDDITKLEAKLGGLARNHKEAKKEFLKN